ncbi:MAG: sulfate adenylyltransferase [Planctomycetota bacterium]|nr:sulfate adenylyltransferase [Planctomycetota bacterium]MCZ6735266.1 sulfate adenylyltransferase [Planctomycetota bacterium]MCZ6850208.1 sulfate adenylyltransferase [Planctomycetota bacterium]
MKTESLITPHGGRLINRIVDSSRAEALAAEAAAMRSITLSTKQACDLEMMATGAFSPLTGFVAKADFDSICSNLRLADGTVWPIPITLAVDGEVKAALRLGQQATLKHEDGTLLAVIDIQEIYPHDKTIEIPNVFGTEDEAHPGVKAVMDEGEWLVAGPIEVISVTPEVKPAEQFTEFRLPPAKTREAFTKRGWKTVTAFQTRNPIHRAHEYLTKSALEICDGLLIHPLVGETQPGDIPADVRMTCYQILIQKYYVADRTMLAVMPAAMRYAGPREAILHALVRKNYGCSHFIVGRDHAGVGDYYGTYDAQEIFDGFEPGEIGITPLKFEHAAWCNACEGMTSAKTCPHGPDEKVFLSGTKVREMLRAGNRPPQEFTRPEVADVLIRWATAEQAVGA